MGDIWEMAELAECPIEFALKDTEVVACFGV